MPRFRKWCCEYASAACLSEASLGLHWPVKKASTFHVYSWMLLNRFKRNRTTSRYTCTCHVKRASLQTTALQRPSRASRAAGRTRFGLSNLGPYITLHQTNMEPRKVPFKRTKSSLLGPLLKNQVSFREGKSLFGKMFLKAFLRGVSVHFAMRSSKVVSPNFRP